MYIELSSIIAILVIAAPAIYLACSVCFFKGYEAGILWCTEKLREARREMGE